MRVSGSVSDRALGDLARSLTLPARTVSDRERGDLERLLAPPARILARHKVAREEVFEVIEE
jgi:hypothetical protein